MVPDYESKAGLSCDSLRLSPFWAAQSSQELGLGPESLVRWPHALDRKASGR
jgi:hypothetical protein